VPILIWNAQHDWVTVRHVGALAGLTPAASEDDTHFAAKTFFEFLGSQFGVVSPVLFVAMVVAMVTSGQRGLRERRDEYLFPFLLGAPPLAFFLLWSVYEKVEGNWAAPAYLTATIALAALWDEQLARAPRAAMNRIVLTLLPGFLMVALAHFPGLPRYVGLTLPPRVDLTRRLDGWRELGTAAGALLKESGENLFLFSDHYQIASELAFYVPGQPRVYNIAAGRRMNQYDIWGGLDRLRGHDGLFVTYGDWGAPRPVQEACEALQKGQVVETSHLGQPGQTFSIFRCVRYKGPSSAPGRTAY
jgi:undecaprenyl-diphosphatase